MKQATIFSSKIRHIFSILLAVVLLASSCLILPAYAEDSSSGSDDQVAAIRVKSNVGDTWFGQKIYLKPDTSYTFSYKYSVAPADTPRIGYMKSEKDCTLYSSSVTYSSGIYKMINYSFKTASLNTDGVIKDETEQLIQHFIGIGFWKIKQNNQFISNPKYNSGEYIYGDFILTEDSDTTQSNLLNDPLITSMQTAVSQAGVWGEVNRTNVSNVAAYRFERYYVSENTYPTCDFFKKSYEVKNNIVENGSVTADCDKAVVGDQISVTVTPDEGYRLLELSANGITIPEISGVYSFVVSDRHALNHSDITINARFCKEETMPAIFIKNAAPCATFFTQSVYLEPETEYVFSYKYSNNPASWELMRPSTGSESAFSPGPRVFDSEYKMISRFFTTPALNTDGITIGTGENNGLIQSNIGIQMNQNVTDDYLNGNSLYGDFTLCRKDDSNKTNIFTCLDYSGMNSSNTGAWRNIYAAAVNSYYGVFDTDGSVDGVQNPSISLFRNTTHTIEVDSQALENGTVDISDHAEEGKAVNVTVTPNTGYWVKGVCVNVNGVKVTKNENKEYSFTMPDQNIVLYANIKRILQGDVNDDDVVNVIDIVRLKKYIAGITNDIVEENSKISDTEEIDSTDIAALKKLVFSGDHSSKVCDRTNILNNTVYRLNVEKKLNIAYFGGSVTYGYSSTNLERYSYRALTTEWFRREYPNASIVENNAAVSGTGTEIGMHRSITDLKLQSSTDRPDLVFIEFAINDVYDSRTVEEAKVNLETIVNTIYSNAPTADIILLFTTDLSEQGTDYDMVRAQKEIAEAYDLPYIEIGSMLWDNIMSENDNVVPTDVTDQVWSKYYADIVHPTNAGHAKYAEYITNYLSCILNKQNMPKGISESFVPVSTLNSLIINPHMANFIGQTAPDGINVDEKGYITSSTSGTQFSFKFTGTNLEMWTYAMPTGGALSFVIDGNEQETITLYRNVSNYKVFKIASGLSDCEHTVSVTLNQSSYGSKMDIRYMLINGSQSNDGVHFVY